ncbi:MAG: hypothetical protein ACN6OJ_20945 [Chryseobacterium sp.]|uniref:hypothetical protein n=1 Tax=Chryseobacterium sp. TaxID=1871047 RepID=UPI003D0CA1B7
MIKQKYLTRDWAETIRLYSGLLDEEHRLSFIKELAEFEILLACECRTTTFADDPGLDEHLAIIAVQNANKVTKPAKSATGLLALAELDKFTEIADFFREIKNAGTQQSHLQVISLYLRNGSENHIFELLKILATSNIGLFSKALDFLLELSFESFTTIQRGLILLDIIGKTDQLLTGKVISLFEVRSDQKNLKEIFYFLLRNRQIKYAEKLSKFALLNVNSDILEIFDNYIKEKENRETLRIFLNILDNLNVDFDRAELNIRLSKSLNPLVKDLSLETRNEIPVTRDLALSICRENIKIGNRSSIDFVLIVREKFNLESVITPEMIMQSLLKEAKFQRIELAYKLAKDYKLNISYEYLYIILTNTLIYENLALARLIVINEFSDNDRRKALQRICCLAFKKSYLNKLARQILLEDLQDQQQNYEIGKEYHGYVSGSNSGKLQIHFSVRHGSIDTPIKRYRSKPNSIVTFRFVNIAEKLEASDIQLTSSFSIPQYTYEYWYKDFYLGQIINFKPTAIREKSAIMQGSDKKASFLLIISEIAHHYVSNIKDYISLNSNYKVQISGFDHKRNTIYCSMKSLKKQLIMLLITV